MHQNASVLHSIFFTHVGSYILIPVNKAFQWLQWCKSAQKSKMSVKSTLECTFPTDFLNLKKKKKNLKSPRLQREPRSQEDQSDIAYKHHYILAERGPATVVLRAINANVSICVQNTTQ